MLHCKCGFHFKEWAFVAVNAVHPWDGLQNTAATLGLGPIWNHTALKGIPFSGCCPLVSPLLGHFCIIG